MKTENENENYTLCLCCGSIWAIIENDKKICKSCDSIYDITAKWVFIEGKEY